MTWMSKSASYLKRIPALSGQTSPKGTRVGVREQRDGSTARSTTALDPEPLNTQRVNIAALGVTAAFDAEAEIQRRVAFIAQTLRASGRETLVLGISGGVDSPTAGRLCQLAVQHLR